MVLKWLGDIQIGVSVDFLESLNVKDARDINDETHF